MVLVEIDSISQVRVSLKKIDLLNFVRMGTGVTQDEQSIPDVNDVDQPLPDNGVAPHDDLSLEIGIGGIRVQELGHCCCGTGTEGGIFRGDHGDGGWPEKAGLGWIGRSANQ